MALVACFFLVVGRRCSFNYCSTMVLRSFGRAFISSGNVSVMEYYHLGYVFFRMKLDNMFWKYHLVSNHFRRTYVEGFSVIPRPTNE